MKLERQRLTALSVLLVAAALVRGDEDKQRIIDQRSIFQGHQAEARSVAYAPGGKILASGGLDNALVLWDVRTGRIKHTLRGGKEDLGNGVCSVAFSPDGKIVAGGGEGSQVRLWDTGAGELLLTIRENRGAIHSIAFAPDGKTIASVGNDLVLCDARTGEFKLGLEGATILWSVCFSPDGKTVAAGGHAEIRVWDTETGKLQGTLQGHTNDVTSVAFSPDGKTLASTGGDDTVILWDTATWKEKRAIHPGMVRSLGFSPGGTMLAICGGGTISLLDAQTDAVLFKTPPQNSYHVAAAFSPGADFLASACMDGTVSIWKLQPPSP